MDLTNRSRSEPWRFRPWILAGVLGTLGASLTAEEVPWALHPVARPDVPEVASGYAEEVRNPIDAFLLQTLEEFGLEPAPEADRRTLIRRLTFDLIGLPPSPEEVEAFLADERPDAYERLVDRLLESPHYGERWARHWLDLVRFAETHGYERDDPKPNAWRYRDWVVRALNQDMPYDRFLVEQLAGDELPDADLDALIATGIYRLGLIDDEPADPVMDRFDQLDDMLQTIGTTMLGLTIHCARCHDHKFDPIPQADYYRLLAFLTPGQPFVRHDLDSISLVLASPEAQEAFAQQNAALDAQIAERTARIAELREPRRQAIIAERRREFDDETKAALDTPEDQRTDAQKALVAMVQPALNPESEAIDERLDPKAKARKEDLERQIAMLEDERPEPLPRTLGLTDATTEPEPTRRLIRGDAHHPGEEVEPGFLSILDPEPAAITPPGGGATTGRRLALARWVASPENPLTARVMVNRLWQHHFGRGLVGTPSDFGAMGEEPSHPELLDWLAVEFIERGWSLKAMHRLMVTSASYRRSGRPDPFAAEYDPANTLLWRMAPRRLEAEPIRDAVLAVAGALNREVGGPSVRPPIDPAVLAGQSRPGHGWEPSDPRDAARRSLYVYVKRTLPLPELELLDAPDSSEPCPQRPVTTTAPQALTLLNGAWMHEQAGLFADRLVRETGDDPEAQVERAFALALNRAPTESERHDSLAFLEAHARRIGQRPHPEDRADPRHEALRAFCLVLLNTNEFVTID